MKRLLLSLALLPCCINAQTVLFEDNFENGAANWTINTPLMEDEWIIDNLYPGAVMDLGFMQIPITDPTPDQPAAITNSPQSNYLHIYSPMFCMTAQGCNAYFSGGAPSVKTATLTNALSSIGKEDVTVSFYYMSVGKVDSAYAQLQYSTDNINWINLGSPLVSTPNWTTAQFTDPALSEQTELYFRFAWENRGTSAAGPAAAIDELKITGTDINSNSIINVSFNAQEVLCENSSKNIPVQFSSNGTFNSGNMYIAELSDASGSFSNPVIIGTLSSAAAGNLSINATIPSGLAPGNGYQIRISSSAPQSNGITTAALTVNPKPVVSLTSVPATPTIYSGESVTITAAGASTYVWTPATILNTTSGATVIATPSSTQSVSVTGTNAEGCSDTKTFLITVNSSVGTKLAEGMKPVEIYPNPSTGVFFISNSGNIPVQSVEVISTDGKTVHTSPAAQEINLSSLRKGIYFIKINTPDASYTERVELK